MRNLIGKIKRYYKEGRYHFDSDSRIVVIGGKVDIYHHSDFYRDASNGSIEYNHSDNEMDNAVVFVPVRMKDAIQDAKSYKDYADWKFHNKYFQKLSN